MPIAKHPHLICFTKAPVLGQVKTRLAASIGEVKALAIYNTLLTHTAACLHAWPGPKTLSFSGDENLLDEIFGTEIPRIEQHGRTLGQRMYNAVYPILEKETVALIGCDCPEISSNAIFVVSEALATADASFGPSDDGGYWCIALAHQKAAEICLAADLPWSQESLISETQNRLTAAQLSYSMGPRLNDIDTLEDLQAAEKNGFKAVS